MRRPLRALAPVLLAAAPLFAHYGEFESGEELLRPLEPPRRQASVHFGVDLSPNLVFGQFDLWNGLFVSRWGEDFGLEADVHWGWEYEELRETLAAGLLFGSEGDLVRGFLSFRVGAFHPADFANVSPWLGLGWSQEFVVGDLLRLEAGTEGGVRLGEEFHYATDGPLGTKRTQLARCWAALFFKIGI